MLKKAERIIASLGKRKLRDEIRNASNKKNMSDKRHSPVTTSLASGKQKISRVQKLHSTYSIL